MFVGLIQQKLFSFAVFSLLLATLDSQVLADGSLSDDSQYGSLACINKAKNPCGTVDTLSVKSLNNLVNQVAQENPLPKKETIKDEALKAMIETADPAQTMARPGAASPNKKITDVATFIQSLPESMRGNSVILSNSRSIQGASAAGTAIYPRVILKSPNADAAVAFNTHGSLKGSNEVEMIVWNPGTQSYDFTKISFAEGKAGEAVGKLGARAIVKRNPPECKSCHGDPARPKWDPGPEWAGQIPFMGDKLPAANNLDTRQYRAMVVQLENAKKAGAPKTPDLFVDRMKSLILPSVKDIDAGVASGIGVVIKNTNEPGGKTLQCNKLTSHGVETTATASRMFDQFSMKNFCSIANELKKDPNWDKLKYAVYGALEGCTSIGVADPKSDFLPPAIRSKAIKYFEARTGSSKDAVKIDPVKMLEEDLNNRYTRFEKERIVLEDYFVKQRGGGQADWYGWMEKGQHHHPNPDRESGNAIQLASLRYVLEPMGVDVNRWSFSVDQNNYTMGNLLGLLKEQPALQAVKAEIPIGSIPCTWLKEKSRSEISKIMPRVSRKMDEETAACKKPGGQDLQLLSNLVTETHLNVLTPKVKLVLQKCAKCHTGSNPSAVGADDFQLMKNGSISIDGLQSLIKSSGGLLGSTIEARIFRAQDSPGAMPPTPEQITSDERQTLLNWLRAVEPKAVP